MSARWAVDWRTSINDKHLAFVSAPTIAIALAAAARAPPATGQDRAGRAEASPEVAAGSWSTPRPSDGPTGWTGRLVESERDEAVSHRRRSSRASWRANRIFKENDAEPAIGDSPYLAALADVDALAGRSRRSWTRPIESCRRRWRGWRR